MKRIFLKNGYLQEKVKIDSDFVKFADYIKKFQLPLNFSFAEKKGYPNDIFDILEKENKNFIVNFANEFKKRNNFINKVLISSSLLQIGVYKSYYNEDAIRDPTHAMLWHRDFDDFVPHVYVFLPLSKTDARNGALHYINKDICKENEILIDDELLKSLNKEDEYRYTDRVRVSNTTMSRHFKESIREFKGDIGDALFIDTNNCYHRGGRVLEKNLQRDMLVLSFGGITHVGNDFSKYNFFKKSFYQLLRLWFRIKHKALSGPRSIKIHLK